MKRLKEVFSYSSARMNASPTKWRFHLAQAGTAAVIAAALDKCIMSAISGYYFKNHGLPVVDKAETFRHARPFACGYKSTISLACVITPHYCQLPDRPCGPTGLAIASYNYLAICTSCDNAWSCLKQTEYCH